MANEQPPNRSEREKMLAGEMYYALDPELLRGRNRARTLCLQLNATTDDEPDLRRQLVRQIFGKGGDTAIVQPPFYCDYGSHIETGESVFFNFNCIVLDVCTIRIGAFTQFGSGVQILTPMHPMNAEQRRKEEYGKHIEIGSDVWVGSGALILPGVKIGSRTVIGAGSVVSRDLPDNVLAVGNPCRIVREIKE